MTEKKTFKNVSSVINTLNPEHTWVVEGFRMASNEFTHREWDMEVTFTKRQPKPEVGGTCSAARKANRCIILGVNGSWVWVTEAPELPGWIVDADDLTDVSLGSQRKIQD